MKIVEASAELLTEQDPLKLIELAGRTCYKSEDKITSESAQKFVNGLIKSGHHAMVEHANFVFEVDYLLFSNLLGGLENASDGFLGFRHLNFTRVFLEKGVRYLVSGNVRAINESSCAELIHELEKVNPCLSYAKIKSTMAIRGSAKLVSLGDYPVLRGKEYMTHTYRTFRFVTDRGVTHEIVRHRPASYAQESTRYCNYTNDKFGNEITVIKPSTIDEHSALYGAWEVSCRQSEKCYFEMIEHSATPQQARAVLPNSLKTEIVMTANLLEWEHFFNLRFRGTTGAPHPDMKYLASKAYYQYMDSISLSSPMTTFA